MYGTVARVRLLPGALPAMNALFDQFKAANVKGALGELMYRMDDDPDEYFMVAIFDSRESYRANAEDPAQHERFLAMRALLQGDPEWHDGEIVLGALPSSDQGD